MVARDGELLIAVLAAVDDFVGGVPGGDPKLQAIRAECGEHMKLWEQFVSEMYQKYGVSEETYRLDVFRGSFSPRVSGERSVSQAEKDVSRFSLRGERGETRGGDRPDENDHRPKSLIRWEVGSDKAPKRVKAYVDAQQRSAEAPAGLAARRR